MAHPTLTFVIHCSCHQATIFTWWCYWLCKYSCV